MPENTQAAPPVAAPPVTPTPEAPKPESQAVELHANNPLFARFSGSVGYSIKTQGVDGAKATSISVLAPKAVASALGVTVKSDNVKLTRQARFLAVKQYIASDIGKDSVNPNVQGLSVRISKGKNGVRKTYTTFEPANTSADDEFFVRELGITLEQVRAMRQAQAAKSAVIDVNGKAITPAANTTEMPK